MVVPPPETGTSPEIINNKEESPFVRLHPEAANPQEFHRRDVEWFLSVSVAELPGNHVSRLPPFPLLVSTVRG